MADEPKFTQADIDAAVAKANERHDDDVAGLKKKVDDLIADNKKLKRGAEIKPEDLADAEARADKAEARIAELDKSVKTLTSERDKAVKALETEQGAGRNYALDAEINGAIAAGNVVPALVPALRAMLREDAKAELVDGKYSVMIGEKPAGEHVKSFLDSEDGKAYRAAMINGGGGAPGGGGQGGGKSMTRSAFSGLDAAAKSAFAKEGGTLVDDAA